MSQERDPILAGDARLVLPEAFVADVMVVDPPYRAHVHEKARSQDQHTDGGVRHNDFGFASLTEEFRTWICKLAARTRRWGLIYTDVESVAVWKERLEAEGATYIRTLPWVRWSMPCLAGDRPPQGFECIVVAHGSAKGRKHWNGAGNLTHLAHLALCGAEKHKTQKPLDQLLDLVSWFSDAGEIVVDPCAGSGTTGLACKILGRNFVGCELDAEWWEKGNARIRACNTGDLPGSLSERDGERFLRWVNTVEQEKGDAAARKANTDRVRKRLADKKMHLERVEKPMTWEDAYQRCLAESKPKTSAVERTIPLPFDVKDWRLVYDRAVAEVGEIPLPKWATADVDPLSPRPCEACQGTGYSPAKEKCSRCNGGGQEPPKTYDLGNGCLITTTIPASNGPAPNAVPTPNQTGEKRGKGRPPGVKNKAPKPWKDAMTRATKELGTVAS